MDIITRLKAYPELTDLKNKFANIDSVITTPETKISSNILKTIFSLIDLTTLDVTDTKGKVKQMCDKVNSFQKDFPDIPNIAAICVYPALIKTVKENINIKNINIASVIGGFPASQTYIEVKVLETNMAVKNGATEADMVISVGKLFEGNYKEIFDEISILKSSLGKAHLKVILETGALTDEQIYISSLIAIEAGADFIKTSTGKINPAATPNAAYIMCLAINEFHLKSGKKIGFKPAGGIATSSEAYIYYNIVNYILGDDWLNNSLFRIGASRLANNLLSDIANVDGYKFSGQYF